MRILYVATVVKTHIMEFHIPYLKMLKEMGWETAVAAKNDYDDPDDCVIPYCDTYIDIPFERNPFNPKNVKAYKKLKKTIDDGAYDIIHCHTPVGAMLTRLASKRARKNGSKVFYTAHGFHFYTGAPLINWIAYYPVEKYLARKTDVLVTITKEDYQRALKFKAGRVIYTPGVGVDTNRFKTGSADNALILRKNYSIPSEAVVFLSVGEVNANKNHKAVIRVLPYFQDVYYVLCGRGPLIDELKALSVSLGVSDRVVFTGYRNDVVDFYAMADIFVFPSYREGLPVALMEAMASGLVCVASKNRGTDDLLPESRLLFSVSSAEELRTKLHMAMNDDCSDEIERNIDHLKGYELSSVLNIMKQNYLSEVGTGYLNI